MAWALATLVYEVRPLMSDIAAEALKKLQTFDAQAEGAKAQRGCRSLHIGPSFEVWGQQLRLEHKTCLFANTELLF